MLSKAVELESWIDQIDSYVEREGVGEGELKDVVLILDVSEETVSISYAFRDEALPHIEGMKAHDLLQNPAPEGRIWLLVHWPDNMTTTNLYMPNSGKKNVRAIGLGSGWTIIPKPNMGAN